MSGSIKLKHSSGNGVSITAPSSNPAADRTLELPSDADGIIANTDSAGNLTVAGHLAVASGSDTTKGARITGGASGGTDIADFRTNNGTVRVKINNDVTVSTGNLVIGTSGRGIDFSAASGSASGSNNSLLDDYEEGTWTPTFDGNAGTNTSGNCTYIKIGNVVHCFFRATHPTTSSPSYATITGLPFTSLNRTVGAPGGAFSETNAGENLSFIVNPNTTYAFILRCDNSGVAVVIQNSISGKDFRGCITYETT